MSCDAWVTHTDEARGRVEYCEGNKWKGPSLFERNCYHGCDNVKNLRALEDESDDEYDERIRWALQAIKNSPTGLSCDAITTLLNSGQEDGASGTEMDDAGEDRQQTRVLQPLRAAGQ